MWMPRSGACTAGQVKENAMKTMGKTEQLEKLLNWTEFWMESIRTELKNGNEAQALNIAYEIRGAWRYANIIGVATDEMNEQATNPAFDLAICGIEQGAAADDKCLQPTSM